MLRAKATGILVNSLTQEQKNKLKQTNRNKDKDEPTNNYK